MFNAALQQGYFARVFFLDPREELRELDAISPYLLLVGASGWGQWEQLNSAPQAVGWFEKSTAFRWTNSPSPNLFLTIPALQLWEQITSQKADTSSDCTFARHALDWTDRDMSSVLIPNFQESRNELMHVLRSALLAQPHLWKEINGGRWVIRGHRNRWIYFTFGRYDPGPLGDINDILHRITPYFQTPLNEHLLAQHLEAARWDHRQEEKFFISIESPSIHERLEAALFWRDWQAAHPAIR